MGIDLSAVKWDDQIDPKAVKWDAPEKENPRSIKNLIAAAVEPNLSLLTGMVSTPVAGLAGLATAAGNAAGMNIGDPAEVVKKVGNRLTYQPLTEGGQNAMTVIGKPFEWLANFADAAGGKITDLTGSPAAGAAVNTAINVAPMALGARGGNSTLVNVGDAASRRLMMSALKPSQKEHISGRADRAVQTLLDEGINATRGGAERLQDRISGLNDEIATTIQNSPAYVGKDSVLRRIDDSQRTFRNQVAPQNDLEAIARVADGFANHPNFPNNAIPIAQAQLLKQGTMRQLRDKYGQMGTAETEAQKALVRGLKEEILKEEPSVGPLNRRESDLINALSMVEKRAAVDANKNPVGLGAVTPSMGKMALFLADRSALVKSLLARMANPGRGAGISDEAALAGFIPQSFDESVNERDKIINAILGRQK